MNLAPVLPKFRGLALVAVTAIAAAMAGCSTLEYRTVQTHFEEAVRADNDRVTQPFMDVAVRYQAIADELQPDYIAQLDAALRPNAWTLRAVSQWRADAFSPALQSAQQGLDEIARQSSTTPQLTHGRDCILLTMLPGLVEDSRLRRQFEEGGAGDVVAHYPNYAARFRTALRALTDARAKIAPATPPEVVAYWNYQAWRVLENWLFIISQLHWDHQGEAHLEADTFVNGLLVDAGIAGATTLPQAIATLEQALPPPYNRLIELERRR